MADPHYDIVFTGKIVDGADPLKVRAHLAKLFNIDQARVENLFSGKRITIKKGLDAAKARNYKAVFAKAGAVAHIVEGGGAAPKKDTVSTPTEKTQENPQAAQDSVSPVPSSGSPASEPSSNLTPPRTWDSDNPPAAITADIAEVGVTLAEQKPFEPANIDTTHLDLAEIGVTMDESAPVPPAEFDTSAFQLDAPGVTLDETPKVQAAEIDTSSLSLDES